MGRWISLALGLFTLPAMAEEVDVSGFIALETRYFFNDPVFPGQNDAPEGSLILNPEFRYDTDDGRHQFTFIPFLRQDSRDAKRSHGDIREAWWLYLGDDWEILAGVNKVFWGVTESRHLVDIINQTDLVEDLDQEDKLGQPMVQLSTLRDWGNISFFVLPGFRERTFPGIEGRLRNNPVIDTDNPLYESGSEEYHVDFALRYAHTFDDFDVGAYWFNGTSREPRFVPNADGSALRPLYELIDQIGVDVQYTKDAWLLKFEGITRKGQGKTFNAAVGGFEYTYYQVFDSNADVGLLFEYLYDGRDRNAPPTSFNDDIFFGLRLALNDVEDSSLLSGVVMDPDSGEHFLSFEAETRVGEDTTLEARLRTFHDAQPRDALRPFVEDDYLQLRLASYF